jgi:hypothetical protein
LAFAPAVAATQESRNQNVLFKGAAAIARSGTAFAAAPDCLNERKGAFRMQHILSMLRRWFGRFTFPGALLASACACASSADIPPAAAPIDDSLRSVGQNYAILCNVCASSGDFINKAVTLYPRARSSQAHVYNLQSGQVRSIVLDWDPETNRQLGGYETAVDPAIRDYVVQAGSAYRLNGNSLSFTLVVRGEGSVYFLPRQAAKVELKPAGLRPQAPLEAYAPKAGDDSALKSGPIPAPGSPVDLRGYSFPSNFNNIYPAYPDSTYDLAFGNPARVNDFVRDQINALGGGGMTGFFGGLRAALANIAGGREMLQQTQAQITVVVPMRDGGWARVTYDRSTGDVKVVEVRDSQGNPMPPGNGSARSYLLSNEMRWASGMTGAGGYVYFMDWAHAHGITLGTWASSDHGYVLRCVSPSNNEITCTLFPR